MPQIIQYVLHFTSQFFHPLSHLIIFCLFIHQVQVRGRNIVIKEGNEQPDEVFDQDFHLVRGQRQTRPTCAWQVCGTGRRAWDLGLQGTVFEPLPVIYRISRIKAFNLLSFRSPMGKIEVTPPSSEQLCRSNEMTHIKHLAPRMINTSQLCFLSAEQFSLTH